MTGESTHSTQSKQVTVEVPESRLAEFYVHYGRFLAGRGRRHGHGPRGAGRRCAGHRHSGEAGGVIPATPESTRDV